MNKSVPFIPEALMLTRIAQSEQLREFFIQMWRENPQMAAKAGGRIQAIMSPLPAPHARHAVSPAPTFGGNRRKLLSLSLGNRGLVPLEPLTEKEQAHDCD